MADEISAAISRFAAQTSPVEQPEQQELQEAMNFQFQPMMPSFEEILRKEPTAVLCWCSIAVWSNEKVKSIYDENIFPGLTTLDI